jgi:hypothetical protein
VKYARTHHCSTPNPTPSNGNASKPKTHSKLHVDITMQRIVSLLKVQRALRKIKRTHVESQAKSVNPIEKEAARLSNSERGK